MAARKGMVPAKSLGAALVPGFLASGTAALAFTGVDHWPGVKETVLALPSLPNYPSVRLADIAWCVVVALAVGLLVAGARRSAREAAARWKRPPVLILVAGGLAVGALAAAFRAIADEPADLVLFSGAESLGSYVAETSAGVLALLVIVKCAGYAISLAAGFRGGPTFPAVALGVALGTLGSLVLPGFDLTPAVIAGVAAGAAAALRLPIFGALLAFVMAGAVAGETVTLAVIASVIGWLAAEAVNRERGSEGEAGDAATAPARRAAHV
jgi:H+/Cl- antiporter ClcA